MSSASFVERSFSTFYGQYFGAVVRSVRPFVGDAAEDVAQEAFIVAQRRWTEVSELDVPFAWVRRVAFRIGARRAQREQMRLSLETVSAPATRWSPDEMDLLDALGELPHRHAAALWLHHGEDRPVDEVAAWLGSSVSAAKVLLHRSRRRIAERVGGLSGRWVSEASWTRDDVVDHLRSVGAERHVETILDEDLEGRGGRWELTFQQGSYGLHRDDGMRLDDGRFAVRGCTVELLPRLATGHVLFKADVDGNRLRLTMLDNTTPPTRGVPDVVWMSLFVDSGPFGFAGRPGGLVRDREGSQRPM